MEACSHITNYVSNSLFVLCELFFEALKLVRTKGLAQRFVMCELCGMDNIPTTSELIAIAGISKSYASEVANMKRAPSRPLAIHLYRETGWRHSVLDGLTDDQISTLAIIEPWIAPRERAA